MANLELLVVLFICFLGAQGVFKQQLKVDGLREQWQCRECCGMSLTTACQLQTTWFT